MREIKFRAWDEEYKKMIYNVGISDGHANDLRLMVSRMIPLKTTMLEAIESIVYSRIHLMQFTGLKDKNGKEIYEGDIFESNNPKEILVRFIVQWGYRDNLYSWGFKSLLTNKDYEFYDVKESMKVIGNIYENPDYKDKPLNAV